MKKRITMSEYRNISPYLCGQLLMRLQKNKDQLQVKLKKQKKTKFKEFSSEDVRLYLMNKILN